MEDYIDNAVIKNFDGAGDYLVSFSRSGDGIYDETEFYAEGAKELCELWNDFCIENGFATNCICDVYKRRNIA